MATLRPYPAYKPSGVPWLGDVPAHWKNRRLDQLFNLRQESPHDGDGRVTAYLDGRVTLRTNVQGQKIKGVIKEAGWQRIYPGDFAISGMNAHLGGMGVSDSLGKCSPIYLVLQPKPNTNAYFVSYAVRHLAQLGVLKSLVNTIRYNSADFKRQDLKSIYIWIPSIAEQAAIVRYLDAVDRLIRRYIRAKRRLIDLLTEQKQAIIHQAVTQGLDPSAPRKPSGVEWLGDIPAHWEVRRLKYLLREQDRRSVTGEETHLSMSQQFGLVPSAEAEERRLLSESYIGGKLVSTGNLVLNRLKAHLGVFAIAPQDGVVSPDYTVFAATDTISMPYYLYILRGSACRTELRKRAKGIVEGFWRLYTEDFYDIRVPYPPYEEQKQIVEQVEQHTALLTTAINATRREIDLIREYRTRLIADVVTGQLDVRNAPLPAALAELAGDLDEAAGDDWSEDDETEETPPEEAEELEEV